MNAKQSFHVILAAFALLGGAANAQPPPTAPARPDILWLLAEDFSPHLGCYGSGLGIPLIIRWPKSFPVPAGFKPR